MRHAHSSVPKKNKRELFNLACPACPVAPADGTGVKSCLLLFNWGQQRPQVSSFPRKSYLLIYGRPPFHLLLFLLVEEGKLVWREL